MKIFNLESNLEKFILVLFFTVAAIEVVAEFFLYKPLLFVFKPLISIVLMVLYWNTSSQRTPLFFIIILFSLITNVLFIPNTEEMLFLGLMVFFIHRLLMIHYVIKLIKIKDYIPLLIAMIPFMFFFFYLLSISGEITTRSYIILIIQNILMSILAGITLSHYVMNYNKIDTWLFIFGSLSVMQYFIVFIEKYYLSELSPAIFRPLAMILNTAVYYAFYKFVMSIERSNDN